MKSGNLILVGSVVFILLAVALVAILDKTSTSNTSDVRARAGTQTQSALKLVGVVTLVDEVKGIVEVGNVQFDEENRSGTAKDLGSWTVTPPPSFNFASVSPGIRVVFAVDSKTFQVTKHEVTALSLVPAP